MTETELKLRLEEINLKYQEAENLQKHRLKQYIYWAAGILISVAIATATITTLIIKWSAL